MGWISRSDELDGGHCALRWVNGGPENPALSHGGIDGPISLSWAPLAILLPGGHIPLSATQIPDQVVSEPTTADAYFELETSFTALENLWMTIS